MQNPILPRSAATALLIIAASAVTISPLQAKSPSIPGIPPVQSMIHLAGLEQKYDCYTRFYTNAHPDVSIYTCNRKSGSSGVYVLSNKTGRDLHVCWTLVFNDGSESKGCKSRLRAGDESASSCYSCNTGNKGVRDVIWHRIDPAY